MVEESEVQRRTRTSPTSAVPALINGQCLINAAGSEGRRSTCAQFTCWSLEAQSFSRALIETQRDLVQLGLRVAGKIGSLRQVLTQQTVGVFVGSSLPGAVRVTEVNFHICGYREGFVFGHL